MKKHAQQVAAWGKLLGHCNTLGDAYKPGKESMKCTAMETLLEVSEKSIQAVQEAETSLASIITDRRMAFDKLPFIGTRVIAALQALGASEGQVSDVNRIRKKFRYQPPEKITAPANGDQPTTDPTDTSMVAQRKRAEGDFDSKLDNFKLMISQLNHVSCYEPYENELSMEGLKAFGALLEQLNKAVAQAHLDLHNARQQRNELLFGENGMYRLSKMIKSYVRSVYGYKSNEFKTFSKIRFGK